MNALCPGATKTAINRDHRQHPDVIESWARKTPLRQVGRDEFLGLPEEIARSALFLASDSLVELHDGRGAARRRRLECALTRTTGRGLGSC